MRGVEPQYVPLRWGPGHHAIQYFVRVSRLNSQMRPDEARPIATFATSTPIEYVRKGDEPKSRSEETGPD